MEKKKNKTTQIQHCILQKEWLAHFIGSAFSPICEIDDTGIGTSNGSDWFPASLPTIIVVAV